MKAYRAYRPVPAESSWTLFDQGLDHIPFEWHYSSEFELTLTLNSRGQRFIGDTVLPYDHEDLVLIGPRIRHTWCSTEAIEPAHCHRAIRLFFTPSFLKALIDPHIELRPVRHLFSRASRALSFSSKVRSQAAKVICRMSRECPDDRLVSLLHLFVLLAHDLGAKPVTSPAQLIAEVSTEASDEGVGRVATYLHRNYRQPIETAELIRIAALSRASLFRLFKHHTTMTIGQYVAQLRIGNACALLLNTSKPISVIASEVGYTNVAHFNRHFRLLRKRTPRDFRNAANSRQS